MRWSLSDEDHCAKFLGTLEKKRSALEAIIRQYETALHPIVNGTAADVLQNHALHTKIEAVAGSLFRDGHYAQAVEEALKRVISEVKNRMQALGKNTHDGGDSLMNHAFGCDNRAPFIKFNQLGSQEERDEQRGIMFL